MKNQNKVALMGIFLALSFIGAYIKFPSPLGTIALDSMPGYLLALMIGGVEGGIVGAVGHILTSANVGFPFTLPVHFVIATMMFISIAAFRISYERFGVVVGCIVATIFNGVISTAVLLVFPQFNLNFFWIMLPILSLASFVNVFMGSVIYKALKSRGIKGEV